MVKLVQQKKQLLWAAIITIILIITTYAALAYTIDKERVYEETTKYHLEAEPHTRTGSGWVEFKATSKTYGEPVVFILFYDENSAKPIILEKYAPGINHEEKSLTCKETFEYNAKAQTFRCYYPLNGTIIQEGAYHTINEKAQYVEWTEEHPYNWTRSGIKFGQISVDFDGFKTAHYIAAGEVTKDTQHHFRIWIDVPGFLGMNEIQWWDDKYGFAMYPARFGTDFVAAQLAGEFFYLDPWTKGTTGLIAYYNFDWNTTNANNMNDTHQDNDCTNVNTATVQAGKNNNSLHYNNPGTDYSDCAIDSKDRETVNTINFWTKPDADITSSSSVYVLFDCDDSASLGIVASGSNAAGSNCANEALVIASTDGGKYTCYSGVINNNGWHMITWVWNTTSSEYDFFLNGTKKSVEIGGGGGSNQLVLGVNANIASRQNGNLPYDGAIDEMGLWNRSLTPGEIETLWNSGAGFFYPLDNSTLGGANNAPVVNSSNISQTTAYTHTTLTGVYNFTDADSDAVRPKLYRWFKNGALIANSNTTTLLPGNTSKADNIKFEVTGYDGTDDSAALNSSQLTISNTLPSVSGISITPSTAYTHNTLKALYTFTDNDSDTNTSTYRWFKGGALISGATNPTLTPNKFNKSNTIIVEVTPNDGTGNGVPGNSSGLVINNSPPTASLVNITPTTAYTNTSLTGQYTYADNDTDAESGTTRRWFKDDALVSGVTGATLNSGNFSKGNVIKFEVTPNDGSIAGAGVNSSGLTISNLAPSVTAPTNASSVYGTDNTNWSVTYSDPDGDVGNVTFMHFVASSNTHNTTALNVADGATASTLYLAGNYSTDNNVTCKAFASDGAATSSTRQTSITVANKAPSIKMYVPLPSGTIGGYNQHFNYSLTDDDGTHRINITLSNGTTTTIYTDLVDANTSVYKDIHGLADGTYTLLVRACENATSAKMCGENSSSVTVDNADPPVIGSFTASPDPILVNGSNNISFTCTPNSWALGGVKLTNVSLNVSLASLNNTYYYGVSGTYFSTNYSNTTTAGTYTARARCTDNESNIVTSSITFTVGTSVVSGGGGGAGGPVDVDDKIKMFHDDLVVQRSASGRLKFWIQNEKPNDYNIMISINTDRTDKEVLDLIRLTKDVQQRPQLLAAATNTDYGLFEYEIIYDGDPSVLTGEYAVVTDFVIDGVVYEDVAIISVVDDGWFMQNRVYVYGVIGFILITLLGFFVVRGGGS